ncbi:hypothetical protein ACVXG9_28635 [Escherichia coli]
MHDELLWLSMCFLTLGCLIEVWPDKRNREIFYSGITTEWRMAGGRMLNIQNEYFHLSVDLARSHLTPREKDVVANPTSALFCYSVFPATPEYAD